MIMFPVRLPSRHASAEGAPGFGDVPISRDPYRYKSVVVFLTVIALKQIEPLELS